MSTDASENRSSDSLETASYICFPTNATNEQLPNGSCSYYIFVSSIPPTIDKEPKKH